MAAAHGLAIGWDAELSGMSSLALVAASAEPPGEVVVAVSGGHGELFVQEFDGTRAESELLNLLQTWPPRRPGPARGWQRRQGFGRGPRLGRSERRLAVGRICARPAGRPAQFAATAGLCPRTRRAAEAGGMMASARMRCAHVERGTSEDLDSVMDVMEAAFGDRYGEAWTRSQCAGILPMAGVSLMLARDPDSGDADRLFLFRSVAGQAELLLLAVLPGHRRHGIGHSLLNNFIEQRAR